jgi:ABC-type ATPase involved in cell division
VLRLIAVSLRHQGRTVLDAVTMEARGGELLVLEGGRGSGKTTLLDIASARRRPDSGSIWIAEHDVTSLQRGSLPFVRRNVGYAQEQPDLLSGVTVLENVMLPLGARAEPVAWAREAALRSLGKLGVVGVATATPERLSTSGRRLVGLARALAGSPPLVLVDDPSASLTAADTGAVLSALLGAVEHGAAVVCTTPDGAFAAAAARAGARRLRMEGGCLLSGPLSLALVATGRGNLMTAGDEQNPTPRDRPSTRQEAVP